MLRISKGSFRDLSGTVSGTVSGIFQGPDTSLLSKKVTSADVTQCGNFRIFVSLRFYVKSILDILEVQNQPFHNLDSYEFLHFLKAEIY